MTDHRIGTREEWHAARLELLQAEKEWTRHGDQVARRRRELPWVRVDKDYRLDTDDGSTSLKDLFRGRSQLIVYHFMFGPDYKAGCPSCSMIADAFNGSFIHLANHDVMLWAVSRAPLEKLQAYKQRMGWSFPWASSSNSDFNFDFNASFTGEQMREGTEYNFRTDDPGMIIGKAGTGEPGSGQFEFATMTGTDVSHLHARARGHERLRPRGRHRLPHLFDLRPRRGPLLRRLPLARPRPQGTQRIQALVPPPRDTPTNDARSVATNRPMHRENGDQLMTVRHRPKRRISAPPTPINPG